MSEKPVIRLSVDGGWWRRTRHTMFAHAWNRSHGACKFPDCRFIYTGPYASADDAFSEAKPNPTISPNT